MLVKTVTSEGIAHNSYLVGSGNAACVIDPRRDHGLYVREAALQGMKIEYVFETHRNEDYVSGSAALAAATGAKVFHADAALDYRYGEAASDGDEWTLGGLKIRAIHTPGHTEGSMSYILQEKSGEAVMVFTGDALFAGDVGRVDFLGMDRAKEMAALLYDSIFQKILPLGDGVILMPAHGPGSLCGETIANRPFTTVGLEKKLNPKLGLSKNDFIETAARSLPYPPYFKHMEEVNLTGAADVECSPGLRALPLDAFESMIEKKNAQVLDVRNEASFCTAHVKGALGIGLRAVPVLAGWFAVRHRPMVLVAETPEDAQKAAALLSRIGLGPADNLEGFLAGGMDAWLASGRPAGSIGTVTVQELCRVLDSGEASTVMDVRSPQEIGKSGRIRNAHNVPFSELDDRVEEIPLDRPVYVFCGSGRRAATSASFLASRGMRNLRVVLGGLAAWNSRSCPLVQN